jgi:hypothetical protein
MSRYEIYTYKGDGSACVNGPVRIPVVIVKRSKSVVESERQLALKEIGGNSQF